MKIAIGCDHIGFELKDIIIEYVRFLGHEIDDFGAKSNERTDYPIYGKKVAMKMII